jgi:hypothetical protein
VITSVGSGCCPAPEHAANTETTNAPMALMLAGKCNAGAGGANHAAA